MQGSSLGRLRNCDLELVLYIVPLLSPLFVTALTVCTSTTARRLSVPNVGVNPGLARLAVAGRGLNDLLGLAPERTDG